MEKSKPLVKFLGSLKGIEERELESRQSRVTQVVFCRQLFPVQPNVLTNQKPESIGRMSQQCLHYQVLEALDLRSHDSCDCQQKASQE